MPTRFRYAKVEPQTFGLSPVDVLLATDAELNQYVGLKKIAPYRKGGSKWDKDRGARLKELQTTLQERKAAVGASNDISRHELEKPKKRKGKKERMRAKATAELGDADRSNVEDGIIEEKTSSTKKRKLEEGTRVRSDHTDIERSKTKRRRHKKSHAAITMNDV
jgi:protein KRI1